MKNIFLILFFLYFLMGCSDQKLTRQETVSKYYNGLDTANYDEIRALINDTITITAGDYVTPYTHESFHEFLKWDSVLKTSYEIVELEEKSNQIIVTIAQNNLRNAFLKNNPLVYKQKVSFVSGKISKLEDLESIGTDWDLWQKERDSLVSWIKRNHSELDGFINDMTVVGALNYLRAIELYETDKNGLQQHIND